MGGGGDEGGFQHVQRLAATHNTRNPPQQMKKQAQSIHIAHTLKLSTTTKREIKERYPSLSGDETDLLYTTIKSRSLLNTMKLCLVQSASSAVLVNKYRYLTSTSWGEK
jgi:hypothetical protein